MQGSLIFTVLTFRVIFFRIVSSRSACSFVLICKDNSSVIVESVGFEEYTDDIIPRFFASLA